jgi:hypothetical protein
MSKLSKLASTVELKVRAARRGQKSEAGSARSLIQVSPGLKRPRLGALFKLVRMYA